jgi:hypothetical protein
MGWDLTLQFSVRIGRVFSFHSVLVDTRFVSLVEYICYEGARMCSLYSLCLRRPACTLYAYNHDTIRPRCTAVIMLLPAASY